MVLVVVALIGAVVGVSATAVRRIQVSERETAIAESATDQTATSAGRSLDDLVRIERALDDAVGRSGRDRSDTTSIDESVALLTTMRTDLATAEEAIVGSQAATDALGARLDVLRGCRRTLDAAARTYDNGKGGAASLLLEAGRATCQRALENQGSPDPPVHPYDFADPHVILVDGTYYAYGTNGPTGDIQILSSTDLTTWQIQGNALPALAPWARPGRTWAPSVAFIGGKYVLHYTVRTKFAPNKQCISSAVSASPTGPFVDASLLPVVCQIELGGSIDPSPYRDELGFWHLSWKSEDETVNGKAKLWTQFLAADGRSLLGTRKMLLEASQDWEGRTIENPTMAKMGDQWVLMFSGNRWDRPDYAMGYAVCASSTGPCLRPERTVVVAGRPGMEGPGGGQFFRKTDGTWAIAYAAWDPGQVGHPNSRRLRIASATMAAEGLVID